jgi:hypothetical protein
VCHLFQLMGCGARAATDRPIAAGFTVRSTESTCCQPLSTPLLHPPTVTQSGAKGPPAKPLLAEQTERKAMPSPPADTAISGTHHPERSIRAHHSSFRRTVVERFAWRDPTNRTLHPTCPYGRVGCPPAPARQQRSWKQIERWAMTPSASGNEGCTAGPGASNP